MKKGKKRNLIVVLTLIAALVAGTFVSSFAVSQEEYDKAQEAAKEAREATEAKRKEAKEVPGQGAPMFDMDDDEGGENPFELPL